MPILADDLKLLAAERMADADDSGGYPSNTVVLDNVENIVFPDIASGDRVTGRTHLRKIHAAVRSQDDDALLASRVYVSEPHADPNTSVGILVTGVSSDDRYAAADALYTAAQQDINTNLRLFQTYNEGEATLTVYAFSDQKAAYNISRVPQTGSIIYLEDETQLARQYVRVISVSQYVSGNYFSSTLTVSPPLDYQFRGGWSDNKDYLTPTQIYLTRAVPLSYGVYGITPLSRSAPAGSTTVYAQSLAMPIAPTITDTASAVVRAQSGRGTLSVPAVDSRMQTATLPDAGIALSGIEVAYTSDGQQITFSGASNPERFTQSGAVVTVALDESPFTDITRRAAPSLPATVTALSLHAGIELIPGAVLIESTRADTGARISALDNGSGLLIGSEISGTVDYDTGDVAVTFAHAATLSATTAQYGCVRTGQYAAQGVNLTPLASTYLPLPGALQAGSLTITANRADTGATITATDDGDGAILSADGISGTVGASAINLTFAHPVYTSSLRASYRYASTSSSNSSAFTATTSAATLTFDAAVAAGGVSVTAVIDSTGATITATDDGLGAFDANGITGTVNYATGAVSLTFASAVRISSISAVAAGRAASSPILWGYPTAESAGTEIVLQLSRPVKTGSLDISALQASDSTPLQATDDGLGALTGDATGTIQYASGVLSIEFAQPVTLATVAVAYQYSIASDANRATAGGMDVVRLPASKSYPLIKVGDIAVVHHHAYDALPNPVSTSTVYSLSRNDVDRIWVEDATGTQLPASAYTADLAVGTVALNTGFDVTPYAQPLRAYTSLIDEAVATAVNTRDLSVRLSRPLSRDYPAGAYLSAAVNIGDLQASMTLPFEQQAWTSVWQNTPIGNTIAAQYNSTQYPIAVRNDGAITERWRISFNSSTTVDVIGEHVGVIATGLSIANTISPLNPYTGQPYFSIPAQGWGFGWTSGYQVRFNTVGADFPLWMIRCVQPSAEVIAGTPDRFRLSFIGDVDA